MRLGNAAVEGLLFGSWAATRWQHSSTGAPGRTLDVIGDLGGSVTLSLGNGSYILTCNMARRGIVNVGGAIAVNDDVLELRTTAGAETERMQWRLVDGTLTLRSEASSCDFDGNGSEEPATFVAVFVRL